MLYRRSASGGSPFIPLIISFWLFGGRDRRKTWQWRLGLFAFVAFLPNAPYVVTDIIHLVRISRYYDTSIVTLVLIPQYIIFIVLGMEAYVISLIKLARYLQTIGKSNYFRVAEISLHALCAIGIYLGRFLRFNSWDLIVNPEDVMRSVIEDLIAHRPILVIDDGSSKPLDAIVSPFKTELNLQLIRQDNAGPATARNTGARQAKGKFLVFTDDDCQSDPDWLKYFETSFQANPDCLVGGHTINKLTDNLYSEASQLLVDYLYTYFNRDSTQSSLFTSNNFALSAERFREIGYFDTTFSLAAGEDREFCDRWIDRGYRTIYLPEALIYHTHHLSWSRFWRQHFNYGRGAFHFHQLRSQRDRQPIKVEPSIFYFSLLSYPFSVSSSHPKIFLSGLFFVSQVANIVGFFWENFLDRKTGIGIFFKSPNKI